MAFKLSQSAVFGGRLCMRSGSDQSSSGIAGSGSSGIAGRGSLQWSQAALITLGSTIASHDIVLLSVQISSGGPTSSSTSGSKLNLF